MSWQDRITAGAYTPHNGTRLPFQFEDVSLSFTLRGSTYDFPDADGTLAQRTGNSSRRFPMRLFFSGSDHDLEATTFEEALRSQTRGKLEHPVYGTLDVTPLGEVRRRDELKTAANQTVIEVTFWNTIGAVYPSSQADSASQVSAAVGSTNLAASSQYSEAIQLSPAEEAPFRERHAALLAVVRAALDPVAEATPVVSRQFNAIYDSLIQGLPVLVQDVATLTLQTALFIQSAGRSGSSRDAFAAFTGLVTSGTGTTSSSATELYQADMFMGAFISGLAVTAINAEFETRPQAVNAADSLTSNFDTYVAWRDEEYSRLGAYDSGEAYQQLQELVALSVGYLVDSSFSLLEERRIVLTRARSPIDLCAELYKAVDERLDFFIESNNLAWDEHLELKAGREVVYYV